MAQIVLASRSPRRQELLRRIGVTKFEILVPDVEEWYPDGLSPQETVAYISREKSEAAQKRCPPRSIIITADTMVFLGSQRLGKPHSEAEALQMLTALSGQRHTVCTGVTVRQGAHTLTQSESTDVYFRPAAPEELRAYIRTGEPMDKAGAYGVQGKGALLVEKIEGDFFNVMGLPVARLARMLKEFDVDLWKEDV
jgi:septum formation protein